MVFLRLPGPDQRDEDAPSYSETIDEINSSIEAFGFQLKRFLDEYSGKAWTAFVNTKSDELAKVATEYTPQEISYFRTLVSLMFIQLPYLQPISSNICSLDQAHHEEW